MDTEIRTVKSFIDSMNYDPRKDAALDMQEGRLPFVTISRQAGAGGRSLALAVMEELSKRKEDPRYQGWQIFDQELCQKMAEDPSLKVSVDSLLTAEYHSSMEDILREVLAGYSSQDVVMKKMFYLIRTLATFGKVIIVGRGSAFLTRELRMGVHVRLVAEWDDRVKRMMQLFNLPEPEARRMIIEQDKGRAKLVHTFFGKEIDDPLAYHAVWNTSKTPLVQIARSIAGMIGERMPHSHKAAHCCGLKG